MGYSNYYTDSRPYPSAAGVFSNLVEGTQMINTNLLDIDNDFFNHVRNQPYHEIDPTSHINDDVWEGVYWGVDPINHQPILGRLWRKVFG